MYEELYEQVNGISKVTGGFERNHLTHDLTESTRVQKGSNLSLETLSHIDESK